jgi:hypothetical protein
MRNALMANNKQADLKQEKVPLSRTDKSDGIILK